MSKSAGNVVLLKDLIAKGIDPLALRLCFLENRYRSQMDLTWDSIKTADSTLAKWRERFSDKSGEIDLEQVATNVAQMALDINLDLDTPRALQKLRKVEKDSTLSPATKHAIALKIDEIIGLELTKVMSKKAVDSNIQVLLLARANARTNKDFKLSDELRDKLQSAGIEVKDTPSGQEWNWL
jgi:cysteinyl-tRNA synthetase